MRVSRVHRVQGVDGARVGVVVIWVEGALGRTSRVGVTAQRVNFS